MIQVPEQFRPHINVDYPPNNDLIFEEWFYNQNLTYVKWGKLKESDIRHYLPIFWTSYYVNNNYGNDRRKLQELQDFINTLDKSKKYFTIVQYDDGILNDLSGLDVLIFGMGGGKYDYPLPLIARPHPYSFTSERDIFCNFMGALNHHIRKELLPVAKNAGYFCSTSHMPIKDYCLQLSRSVFTLCPRGYGVTSFRLAEAVQFGSIPVYISDKHMIPYNEPFDYGVIIEPKDIYRIDEILKSVDIKAKQEKLSSDYFTYDSCKTKLLRHLS